MVAVLLNLYLEPPSTCPALYGTRPLGFRAVGFGFGLRFRGLGFLVLGLGLGFRLLGFRVKGFGFRVTLYWGCRRYDASLGSSS